MGIWYCTREDVKSALDVKETARNNSLVDDAIEQASRSVDSQMNRVFYPTLATRKFDWPPEFPVRSYRLWLDANEVITVSDLSSNGVSFDPSDYLLEPVNYGPPYDRIELNQGVSSSFNVGSTWQQNVHVTGLFGYDNVTAPAGALAGDLDDSETAVDVTDSSVVGVGSLLLVDDERMVVTGKSQLDTGQNIAADLASSKGTTLVGVADGTAIQVGEVILVDAEKMLVVDIAGNNLIVERAYDGSVLAAHTMGADVYAPRTLTVQRAVLGTTAATHSNGTAVVAQVYPGLIKALTVAEAINEFEQKSSAYARTVGSGDNARPAPGQGVDDIRCKAYEAYGRKARMRVV